jgi:ATP-dependent RNA helicase DDX49/DBP8
MYLACAPSCQFLKTSRELAFQISEQFAVLGAGLSIRTAVVVGGMDMMSQALELGNRPHIVVATPGRIVDHLKSSVGEWDLSRVRFLVSWYVGGISFLELNGFSGA